MPAVDTPSWSWGLTSGAARRTAGVLQPAVAAWPRPLLPSLTAGAVDVAAVLRVMCSYVKGPQTLQARQAAGEEHCLQVPRRGGGGAVFGDGVGRRPRDVPDVVTGSRWHAGQPGPPMSQRMARIAGNSAASFFPAIVLWRGASTRPGALCIVSRHPHPRHQRLQRQPRHVGRPTHLGWAQGQGQEEGRSGSSR